MRRLWNSTVEINADERDDWARYGDNGSDYMSKKMK